MNNDSLLTVQDFLNKVAVKYNYIEWPGIQGCRSIAEVEIILSEAIELYTEYKAKQAYLEGFQDGYDELNQYIH